MRDDALPPIISPGRRDAPRPAGYVGECPAPAEQMTMIKMHGKELLSRYTSAPRPETEG